MPGLTAAFDVGAVRRFTKDSARLAIDPDRLLLAVSGGADSLALLLLARAAFGTQVAAATVDHGLRPDARAWAAGVAALCRQLEVPHATLAVRVRANGAGLQAAARDARYAALQAHAVETGRDTVATAHQADDQAETMLMRLMRGSGLAGLAAVREDRLLSGRTRLVRPLIDWSRMELAALVRSAGIAPVDDPANRDPRFDRTRVRALLDAIDPRPLVASARHLAEAEAALAWATAEVLAARVERAGGGWTIDVAGLPREIVRRLLLAVFADAGAQPDGPSLDRFMRRLAAGEPATLGPLLGRPGLRWRLAPAPPRRHSADAAAGSTGAGGVAIVR